MSLPHYPIAMGVIRACEFSVYEDLMYNQFLASREKSKIKSVDDLLTSGNTFTI
jgi:2-oxoglutarate ferredoxin oxidoreductase subunit beta